ncbi:replication-relaxation family protein [Streptomyces viridosporus]|uniref:replication-relaxation family protein n=1 Tax=Streptomyces viridosporus TaxID=67581 RepID=UPI0036F5E351
MRHQALAALAQHRIATTGQLRRMLRPDGTRQLISRALNKLRSDGFVDYTVLSGPDRSRTQAWYLTPDGARLTRDLPVLRDLPALPDHLHHGGVAEDSTHPDRGARPSGLRRRCPPARARTRPRDRTPEVPHSIGEGERVVADAVLHYTLIQGEQRRKLRAFVEVDRATMSGERLAVKLIEYARLHQYEAPPVGRRRRVAAEPGRLRWYPVFPRVLFVLTGAPRTRLEGRIGDLQAMAARHPLVAAPAGEVALGAAVLEDLEQHGPAQDVWTPLPGGTPRPWTDL